MSPASWSRWPLTPPAPPSTPPPLSPGLLEQLWLLLPGLFPRHRRVRSSREARHLIRTLRLRLAKVGEKLLGGGELADEDVEPADRETCLRAPGRPGSQNDAPTA